MSDKDEMIRISAKDAASMGVFLTFFFAWFLIPLEFKITGIIESAVFSGIEACFRRIVTEGRFRTELAGFFANALLAPFFMSYYWLLFDSNWTRVFFFPVSLWILEIFEDIIVKLFFGTNHVWHYDDDLAYLDGAISLWYTPAWWAMGIAAVPLHPAIFNFCETAVWVCRKMLE
jgi:hypothetical protein